MRLYQTYTYIHTATLLCFLLIRRHTPTDEESLESKQSFLFLIYCFLPKTESSLDFAFYILHLISSALIKFCIIQSPRVHLHAGRSYRQSFFFFATKVAPRAVTEITTTAVVAITPPQPFFFAGSVASGTVTSALSVF